MTKAIRSMIVVLGILLPTLAQAQTFPKPPDVPAYVAVTPTYAAGTANTNTPVDPNVTPPTATQLTDVASTATDQMDAVADPGPGGDSGFCVTTADGGSCLEAKFRTHANCTKIAYTDPIRNYGQQNTSHLHQFFGNVQINDFSTFQSLRTQRRSLAGGGDMNGTGYWFPAPIKTNPFGDGKNYSPKCMYAVIYYLSDPAVARQSTDLYRGLRYVSGSDMDDPQKQWLRTIIANANTANAAAGGSGSRYRIDNPLTLRQSNDFVWVCSTSGPGAAGEVSKAWLKNSDGSDPWAGACVAGDDMSLRTTASNCWDGKNLWSPGGYSHVIQTIYDTQTSKFVCPNNYYRLPELLLNIWFEQNGFADYGEWRLSSDDMFQTKIRARATAGDTGYAGLTTYVVKNGESAHFDWMNGWNGASLTSWLRNCIGAQNGTPHECGDGRISATQSLKRAGSVTIYGSTQQRNPQVDLSNHPTTVTATSGMFVIPAAPNGPVTVHVHGS